MGDRLSNTCDECERPWDEFGFCDSLCMLQVAKHALSFFKCMEPGAETFEYISYAATVTTNGSIGDVSNLGQGGGRFRDYLSSCAFNFHSRRYGG